MSGRQSSVVLATTLAVDGRGIHARDYGCDRAAPGRDEIVAPDAWRV